MRHVIAEGQYFTAWAISEKIEEPFNAPMVELHLDTYRTGVNAVYDIYNSYQVSQIKEQFLHCGRFLHSAYPIDMHYDRIKLPDGTTMVDFSGFWFYPTDITVYSKLYIDADEDAELPLSLRCNGSVIAWVDGKEAFRVVSEAVNHDTVTDVTIKVRKGRNELVVGVNELGERNTMIRFGLCNKSGRDIKTSIPIEIDEESLDSIRDFIDSLDMKQVGRSLDFFCNALDTDLEAVVSEDSTNKQTLNLAKGTTSFSCPDIFREHLISVKVVFEGVDFSKKFYRFAKQRHEQNIGETEEERKKDFIDSTLEEGTPNPALFIAGLSRGMNLYEKCKKAVQDSLERIFRRADCSDFRLTEIIWMYGLGKNILPQTLLNQFKEAILGYRYWFTEKGNDVMWFFSENHALSQHACEYIAGRLFPDEVFSNSGMTGKDHMRHGLKMIREWFSNIFAYGYTEYCSVNYLPIDMLGYMTLLKFAENPEIEVLCRQALDMTFEIFALQCHKGMLLGANARTYINDVLSPTDIQANAFSYFAWGTGFARHAYRATLYALTDYECPKDLRAKALPEGRDMVISRFVQSAENVQITIVKTKDWFMGSSISPLEGKPGDQEHVFDVMVGDEDGRLWINHPGESKLFGTRRPGYFTGNAFTPHVSQYLSSAVVSYRFPDTAEVNFTHLICHRECFDKQVLEDRNLFLRRGDVNVYVHAENGLEIPELKSLHDFELRSPGLSNTWYVRLDDSMDFETFMERMRGCTLKQQDNSIWIQDPVYGLVRYTTMQPVLEIN